MVEEGVEFKSEARAKHSAGINSKQARMFNI